MPHPLYFAENSHGKLGIEFDAVDRDTNSRDEVIRLIRNGSISPRLILEVYEPCEDFPRGQVSVVTDELIAEANEQRDPATLDESCQKLRNMLAAHDRKRDLQKHGVFGW